MNQLNLAGVLLSLGLGIYLFVSQSSLHDKVDKLNFDLQQAALASGGSRAAGDTSQMILPPSLQGETPEEVRFPEAFFCLQPDRPTNQAGELIEPSLMYFDGRGGFAFWDGSEKVGAMSEAGAEVKPKLGKVDPTLRGAYAIAGYFVFAEVEDEQGRKRRRRLDVIYFQKTGNISHIQYEGKYYTYFACSWHKGDNIL